MKQLLSMLPQELEQELLALGEPRFRASQVFGWLHRGATIGEMRNIPLPLREKLANRYSYGGVKIAKRLVSKDSTVKYLYALEDGEHIEGAKMTYKHGVSLCVSTQVGCSMGCAFCASTIGGCVRDLTAGEMLSQVLEAGKDGARVTHIVLMGSGEPLLNLESVIRFFRLVNAPEGLHISLRNVSLSTCGIPEGIERLAEENFPIALAISLHAPNDDVRREIMPVAHRYPMDGLLRSARDYVKATGRRVIFEYVLIDGLNDKAEHAAELASKLRGLQCHVNLIPLNALPERQYRGPSAAQVAIFLKELENRHISATVRRSLGADIAGACGQLRRKEVGI